MKNIIIDNFFVNQEEMGFKVNDQSELRNSGVYIRQFTDEEKRVIKSGKLKMAIQREFWDKVENDILRTNEICLMGLDDFFNEYFKMDANEAKEYTSLFYSLLCEAVEKQTIGYMDEDGYFYFDKELPIYQNSFSKNDLKVMLEVLGEKYKLINLKGDFIKINICEIYSLLLIYTMKNFPSLRT